jgi:hypothetical protein
LNAIINYLDKYTTQIFVLQLGILFILSAILIWVYLYNRKKYHNLKHQIPASVVKNYLDSIIQNSTALKSSLFRGGGLDVDPSSIPSVMPLDQLQSGAPVGVSVDLGSGGDEALRAEVARLQSQLAVKDNAIKDLENKNTELEGIVKAKQERIEELEALLATAQAEGGAESAGAADPELQSKLDEVTAERDRLKEDLSQYDIIEDDLADLKRLKQENEQLKSALEGGDAPAPAAAPVEEPVAEQPAPEPEAEPAPEPEPVEAAATEEQPAVEPVVAAGDDKSPEDLLSEFEKMLG